MQGLKQIDRYFHFAKVQVFDQLHSLLTTKSAIYQSFQGQLQQQIDNVSSQLELLCNQKTQWGSFSSQFDMFIQTFSFYRQQMKGQTQFFMKISDNINEELLYKLQQCQKAYSFSQSKLMRHGTSELQKLQKRIDKFRNRIQSNKKQIESYHEHCFVRMLEFSRSLNENNIKQKINQKYYDLNTYGKMSSEMKKYLVQTIAGFQDLIFQDLSHIQKIQGIQQDRLDRVINSFNRNDEQKIKILKELAHNFAQDNQIIVADINPYKYIVEKDPTPKRCTFAKTKRMETAVHITLHPLNYNQLLIEHRQSISGLISSDTEIEKQVEQEDIMLSRISEDKPLEFDISLLQKSINFECPSKLPEDQYSFYKHFIASLNTCFEECSNQKNLSDILVVVKQLKKAQKFKQCRQLVVFFLYYQVKKNRQFCQNEQSLLIDVTSHCLKQCFDLYDSESIIKLLIISLQVSSCSEIPFYLKIDTTILSDNFQFWETTYIQNIYQYCEMMVKYYEEQLQQALKKKKQKSSSFFGIFKSTNWFKGKDKNQKGSSSFQEIYPQIFKNIFTIDIALMRVYSVSHEVVKKLVNYLDAATQKLNFSQKQTSYIHKQLKKMMSFDEKDLMELLKNEFLVERSLSKLLGPNQKDQEENQQRESLSESILRWQKKHES